MNKEIFELLHKQDSVYYIIGCFISADNNMTEGEEKCNKEELQNIVELCEQLITDKNSTIPEESLVSYHKLALNSLKVFEK